MPNNITLPQRARRFIRSLRQAIPSGVVIGRRSSGEGPAEFIPLSEISQANLDAIGATRGSILFRGANGWEILTPGTAGQTLHTNGVGADPDWNTDDTGGVGAGGGAWSFVQTVTGSGVSSVDINLPDADQVKLVIDADPADDGIDLEGVITDDGFTTVETGASDYRWAQSRMFPPSSDNITGVNGDAHMVFCEGMGNDTGEGFVGEIICYDPQNANRFAAFKCEGILHNSGNNSLLINSFGAYETIGTVDGLRLRAESGNMDITVHVYSLVTT